MVTAKFKVSRVSAFGTSFPEFLEKLEAGEAVQAEVEMTPDYAQGKNAEWAAATPSGVIRLTIQNPAALKQLISDTEHNGFYGHGKSVDVTFAVSED